jgi:ABC-type antimicrobial peptide transport system permease subunit
MTGAFRERVRNAWTEIRENLGRSVLQSLGVVLGVASVLAGFSISDSMRRRSKELFVRWGGLDKLNVQPLARIEQGRPSALEMANLGLRQDDALRGEETGGVDVKSVAVQKMARTRVRSAWADREREIRGVNPEFFPMEGLQVAEGRLLTREDVARAAPVAVLGTEALAAFFPSGNAVGQTIRIGEVPVRVVGVLRERVFRFRNAGRNIFRRQNRIIAVPSTLVSRRFEGDSYARLDRVTFKIREMSVMEAFSKNLEGVLKASHRQQEDFRLDDFRARMRREESQDDAYNLIFVLSGVLSLVGGGIVNVNVQLATLKERIREVGVKMAIGAPGGEIFKEFVTEAMLLSGLGAAVGLGLGIGFSKIITLVLGVHLHVDPKSFLWAFLLAAVFGFLFALYPAFKASRQSPMEALRYE